MALLVAIIILLYAIFRARKLRRMAFEIFYHFISNCNSLQYYRDDSRRINNVLNENYDTLVNNKDKWFLKIASKRLMSDTISLYELTSKFTEDVSPFFSLDSHPNK